MDILNLEAMINDPERIPVYYYYYYYYSYSSEI